jgi:hypothetical protein
MAYLTTPAAQPSSGVTVSVANARLDNGYFYVDLCYDRPDDGNWLARRGTLEIGSQVFQGIRSTPIELRDWPVDGQQLVRRWVNSDYVEAWESALPDAHGQRCDTLDYEVGSGAHGSTYTLTIQSLVNRAGTGAPGNGDVIEGPWVLVGTF